MFKVEAMEASLKLLQKVIGLTSDLSSSREDFKPGQKKRQGSREMLEEQKMRHKLKQERKGARKEIRADNAFLATQRAKLARAKDVDRQEKTKAIFSGLASQEGDYKKLLKKKKKF